ncbi:glycoside hydrolase family 61 protein, partial [Candidatus Bathyarchaeota archaeon]|nr:glycoside hydrolase family 61 protein [Candidatus Bathyarchaeota archaeon]
MHFATKLAAFGGLASTAAAHGIVNAFVTDGKWNNGFQIGHLKQDPRPEVAGWTAQNLDHGFVSVADYETPDIICHRDAEPSKYSGTVSAGGTVEFQWTEWPVSHPGPVMTYVANCNGDCADVDKEALKWVKIEEVGYVEEEQE